MSVTHPIDQAIGKRIRAARRAKRLTQTQLGHRLGVSFQQIQKYESGANRLSGHRLVILAETLEQPVSWMLGTTEGDGRVYDIGVPLACQNAFSSIEDKATRERVATLWEQVAELAIAPRSYKQKS